MRDSEPYLVDSKKCVDCGETKSANEFTRLRRVASGLHPKCKVCKRAWERKYHSKTSYRKSHLKRDFGLSLEAYSEMHSRQNGVCAICDLPETTIRCGSVMHLAVDHCHETNSIRGLLCNNCNRALGMFGDSTNRLRAAISYLSEVTS